MLKYASSDLQGDKEVVSRALSQDSLQDGVFKCSIGSVSVASVRRGWKSCCKAVLRPVLAVVTTHELPA
eukprot:2287551-Amphidinium_carterae.3